MDTEIVRRAVSSIQTQDSSSESLAKWQNTNSVREWKTEEDGIRSLSCYRRDGAGENEYAEGVAHLKAAFPDKAKDSVCIELLRLATKKSISREQFNDAVDNFIETHSWNTFTVADILNYDVRVRLYTGTDVYNACKCYGSEYDRAMYPKYGRIDGIIYHVKASEVEMLPPRFRMKIKERIEQFKNEEIARKSQK